MPVGIRSEGYAYETLSRFGHSRKRDQKIAMEVIKPSSFRSSILSKLNIGGRTKITMLPFVEIICIYRVLYLTNNFLTTLRSRKKSQLRTKI